MFWYKIHYSSVYVLDVWVLLSRCRYCSPLSSTFGFRERCWKVFKDVRLLAWLLKNWFGEKLENIHTQIQKQEAGTSPEHLVTWVAVVIFFKRRQIWVSSVYPLSLIFTCIFCLSEVFLFSLERLLNLKCKIHHVSLHLQPIIGVFGICQGQNLSVSPGFSSRLLCGPQTTYALRVLVFSYVNYRQWNLSQRVVRKSKCVSDPIFCELITCRRHQSHPSQHGRAQAHDSSPRLLQQRPFSTEFSLLRCLG